MFERGPEIKKVAIDNDILLTEVANILAEGREVVMVVRGLSMRPFLFGDKDSVVLEKKESYGVGDIVLAKIAPARWVLHRLIAVDGTNVTLKGDGNLDSTERCSMGDLVGHVVEIQKPCGKKINTLTAGFARRSRLWRNSPRLFRRVILKFLRMTVKDDCLKKK